MTNLMVASHLYVPRRDDGRRAFAVSEAVAHDFLVGSLTNPDTAAVSLMTTAHSLRARQLWKSLPRDRLQKEYLGTITEMMKALITELIYVSYRQREIHLNYNRPRFLGSSSALAACVIRINAPSPSVAFRAIGLYFNPTGEYPFIFLDPQTKPTKKGITEGRWSYVTNSMVYPREMGSTLHFFKTRKLLEFRLRRQIILFKKITGKNVASLEGDFIFLHGKGVNVRLPPQQISGIVSITRELVHFEDVVVFEKSQRDMAGGEKACAFCASEAVYRILRGEIPGPHRSLKLVIKGILEHCSAVAFRGRGATSKQVCSIDRYAKRLRRGSKIRGSWRRMEVIVQEIVARSFALMERHRLLKRGGSPSGRVVAYLGLARHATVISYEPKREYPWIFFNSAGLTSDSYRRRDGKKMGAAFYFFMESVSLLRHIQQKASIEREYFSLLQEYKSEGRIEELTPRERKRLAMSPLRRKMWGLTFMTLSPGKEGKLLTVVKSRQSRRSDRMGDIIARKWNLAIGQGGGEEGEEEEREGIDAFMERWRRKWWKERTYTPDDE